MRKKIAVALILVLVLIASCGCEKKPPEIPSNDRFDIMPNGGFGGGFGGNAVDVTEYSTAEAKDYYLESVAERDIPSSAFDENGENVFYIELSSIKEKDLSNVTAYSYKDGELTVKEGGVFVLSGSFLGTITVSGVDEDVRLVLDGVDIKTLDSQNSAAIVFKKPSGDIQAQRIITLAKGSSNTLSDSVGDDENGDGAVIQAKKRSLVINGEGSLTLNCVGAKSCGIKVKTELFIDSANIVVNGAKKSGIKADEAIVIKNADIAVTAGGDGIKTDLEPESEEEARKYASNPEYGYIYVENSSLDIVAGDDGISANGCLFINNTEEYLVKILTNGGAPSVVTEASSDNADGKGLKTDGIEVDGELWEAGYTQNYGLVITGGRFEINSNDDGVHSKGNVLIMGGTLEISSGDDGIHAEYLTKISGGDILVTKSYEGIEGAVVEILGGNIDVTSTDDGINAANSDLVGFSYYILIAGGNISVDAEGDGLDSNGTLKITGGELYVEGPTRGDNSALDADSGIVITGGNVCAVGAIGMVESPSAELSTQAFVVLSLSDVKGGSISVKDESGKEILSLTPSKAYQSVILSLGGFEVGKTYEIVAGGESVNVELSSIGTTVGNGGFGGFGGGRPDGGGFKPDGRR